jgi:hypothetical protein
MKLGTEGLREKLDEFNSGSYRSKTILKSNFYDILLNGLSYKKSVLSIKCIFQ